MTRVEDILAGAALPMRDQDIDLVQAELIVQLPFIAQQYGARVVIDQIILTECIELITDNFLEFGIEEIRQAYRLWSLGEIDGLEMYGGEFNVAQLARVLQSYRKYRNRTLNKFLAEIERQNKDRKRKAEVEQKNRELLERFPEMVNQAKFERWDQVPAHWYSLAIKSGVLKKTKEWRGIYDRAVKIAEQLQQKEESEYREQGGLNGIAKSMEAKNKNPEEYAKVIAGKIAVFEKLINQAE